LLSPFCWPYFLFATKIGKINQTVPRFILWIVVPGTNLTVLVAALELGDEDKQGFLATGSSSKAFDV